MTPPIPVVLVLPVLEFGGAEQIVAALGRGLPSHGFATRIIGMESADTPFAATLRAEGLNVSALGISRRRTLAAARALRAAVPRERPLLVHAHLFHANLAARLAVSGLPAAERAGVRVINSVHVAERRFRPWQFALDRFTAQHCAVEVCVSRAVATFQQKQTGLPSAFFPVIENGIDMGRFANAPRSESRGSGGLNVVAIGRLDPQKDFSTLLRAWATVEATEPRAWLTIAGKGPEDGMLRSLAKTLKLQRVEFPGFVHDIAALLGRADVYCQPSAWEGFGLAVAEAMAAGVPPIVSNADSLPELVTHERTGWVVPVGDDKALAVALLKLLKEGALRERLGRAARAEALQRFDLERMVRDYAQLYHTVLK